MYLDLKGLDLKVSIFKSQNRGKAFVPDELGRALEHLNWGLFRSFIVRQPYKSFTVNLQICLT